LYGGKPMSNHDGGASVRHAIERLPTARLFSVRASKPPFTIARATARPQAFTD
jgi:hypothetical protein